MAYYWDHVNDKWEKHRKERNPFHSHHESLLLGLVAEIGRGDSDVKMYAGLLARALVVNDQQLMSRYGEQVAYLTGNKVKRVA